VADFGPKRFKALRQHMITSGLCRGVINKRCGTVKRMIGWAVSEEMIPADIAHALREVKGLKRGRSEARETPKVKPVPESIVAAALPFMPKPVAAMIRLQQLSGARPGEIVLLRTGDLNTAGNVWTFMPMTHKGEHLERDRIVYFGPRCQTVLRPFLRTDLSAYVFSPAEAEADRTAERRKRRATPLWRSHVEHQRKKKAKTRKRPPRDRYDVGSYRRAIARACERADVPRFSPHRIRHSYATDVRREHGLEAAQVLLGHASADVTQVYAEADHGLALKVAAECG
jgi:integrase